MSRGIWVGVAAMAVVVVASNILVQFLAGNWLTWGAFTYPFAFLITDLVNRLYGPSAARRVVIVGFASEHATPMANPTITTRRAADGPYSRLTRSVIRNANG